MIAIVVQKEGDGALLNAQSEALTFIKRSVLARDKSLVQNTEVVEVRGVGIQRVGERLRLVAADLTGLVEGFAQLLVRGEHVCV